MVSKNNRVQKMAQAAERQSHFGIRKLTVGAASVLLGTSLWLGTNNNLVKADTKADSDADKTQSNDQLAVNTKKIDKVVVDASSAAATSAQNSAADESATKAEKSNDENKSEAVSNDAASAAQNAQTQIEKATENTKNKKAEITSSQASEKAKAEKIESAAQKGQSSAAKADDKSSSIDAAAIKGAESTSKSSDLQAKLDEANKKATKAASSQESKDAENADKATTTLNTAELSELGKANSALKDQLGASLVSWDDIINGIGQAGGAISGAINDSNAKKTNDQINEAEKNFKTVDNAMDLISAASGWGSSDIEGVNLKGNINLSQDLNISKNFIIHGLDGATLTLNGGSGSINNNAVLTLDNITVNGSVGGSGKTQIKGTVTSNVGATSSSKGNIEGSGVEVLNDATLTINRAAAGDGISLNDGSTVKVDDNATLNINTNTNGATDTARYHNAGVFMAKGGSFLTGRNSTVNLNTSIGQGIAIGAGRPTSTDSDRFGGYGTGQSRESGPSNVILGDHTTFNFTGRDGIILGNNSNFTTGDYSNVHFENKGRGVALDLANDSNINVSDHSVLYLHSVGKTSSSGLSGSYDGYNYVGVNERGNITVGEYATFRVILEGRGDNAWDDVVSLDSRNANSNAAFTSKKGATVDIRDDNTNFYAELISFPLGGANSRIDIQDPLYVNLQRYSRGGATTGWMPVGGDQINNTSDKWTSNLIYMGGNKGVVNIGGSDYVVYQQIKSDGTKQLWLNVNSVSIPMNGFQTIDPYNNNANPDVSIYGNGFVGGIRANQVNNNNVSPLTGKNAPAYGISTQRASHQIWFPHGTTTEATGTHKNVIHYVYEDGTPVTDASGNPIVKTQELDLDRQIELSLTPETLNKVQEYASTHSSDETLNFIKNNYTVSKDGGWQITNAINTSKNDPYSAVDSPVIDGYTATIKSTNAPGVTVGADGTSVTAKFEMPTEGVVKDGQLTDDFKNKGITGLPQDYDTVVVYKKDAAEETLTVKYIDDTTHTDLTSYDKTITGAPGSELNYSTQPSITELENKGYELVSDGFTQANLGGKMPANGGSYEVHVKHGTTPVNPNNPGKPGEPINPNDPDGPKYPDGTASDDLTKDVTRTIKYVDNTGKEVAPSVDQKVTFTQSGVLDKVTGDWTTPLTWSGDQTVKAVVSPTVDGYHVVNVDRDADGNNVAQKTLTHTDSNYTVTVTYAPNDNTEVTGKQTVHYVDSEGKTLRPDQVNDSFEFVKDGVSGKWNETSHTYKDATAPVIDGYVTSSKTVAGKTVTPEDPNAEITIVYNKIGNIVPQDPNGNPIPDPSDPSKTVPDVPYKNDPDDPTKVVPNEPVPDIPGYTPNVPSVTPEDPTKDTPVVYTKNDDTKVTGKQTVHYVDSEGKELRPDEVNDSFEFVKDGVNGKWNETSHTYKDATAPVIDGYVTSSKTVAGKTVTPENPNAEITIVYNKIGNIVPQDPNGNPIPDPSDPSKTVPDVPYKNDPDDPTKVVPNEPVPDIPGYTPNVPSVTPEDPTKDTPVVYTKNDDTKVTGKQTVHYVDSEGKELRPDQVNDSFEFVKDGVSGKWNETSHTYKDATAPVIDGYVTSSKTVQGKTVTPENPNAEITIVYNKVGKIVPVDPNGKDIPDAPTPSYKNDPDDPTKVVPNEPVPDIPGYTPNVPSVTPEDPTKDTPVIYTKDKTPDTKEQKAQVQYIDQTDNDKILETSPELTGKIGDKIVYSTADVIKKYLNEGYELVNDGFPADAAFDNIDGNEQIFKVIFKHGTTPVNPENPGKPGEPINPNDPDGPKWPDGTGKDSLTKTGTQTIHYQGAGDKTPKDNVQDTTFSHEMIIDKVTGEIIKDNGWTPESHTFGTVDTPVVEGYHADKKTAGGKTVTVDNLNAEETVTYTKNGKIVPVDPEGNKIPNVDNPTYPTDPNDPTKVVPNEPVPSIPGYTPETPTVTPNDPGKDTPVIYNPIPADKGQVIVKVHDNTANKDLPQYGYDSGEQEAGTKVDFNKNATITELENKGYKVINPDVTIPGEITKGSQTVTIYVEHTTTTVTPNKPGHPGEPVDPDNPNGPKYPDGTSLDDLKKTGTQTIHYTGAGDNTPKDNVQSFDFTKKITFDNVTGEIIDNGEWNVTSHEFGTVNTPVVEGYHADKRVAGGKTVTIDNLNAEETVTYTKNGKIVPVDPEGNKIPNVDNPTYPTDPDDPTKVVPDEPVPSIPGMTPQTPTVTPKDPGKDTEVIYTPNPVDKGQVTVTVHDNTTDQDLPQYGYDSGEQKTGTKVDFNKTNVITDLTNKGYKVINPNVEVPTEVTKGNTNVVIYVEHGTTPVNPDNPGKPGQPINPNDPDGPKWPSESGDVTKDVTRTIVFVDNNGKEVHPSVDQTVHFTASGVLDKVTGKWVTPLTWSPAQEVSGQNVPFVENYHVVSIDKDGKGKTYVEGVTLDHNSNSYKVTVTYAENGKIVPVDPQGNKIPNVDNPTYPTDPSDPSKVVPNEPVPSIPGMTPETPTVTPNDPGKDTPVIYNPIPADKGQVIVKVHDNTANKDLPQYGYDSGEQEAGTKVDFNKNATITELENKGYKVINPDVTIPSEITKGSQTVTIYVEHTTTTVTPNKPGHPGEPVDPDNPNGPKYPDGTSLDDLKKTGTQTIHYTGAGDNTPKDNVQSFDFTKKITFDNVTGEIIDNGEWNVTSHEFGTVNTPVVEGYHADKRVAGGKTVTIDNLNAEVTVTYTKNGKIVPVDPQGNPIPNVDNPTYPTDPDDPTKVVPDEPVPSIPGMTPETSTVTPKDPGKDTKVIYNTPDTPTPVTPTVTTVVGKQTITFVDGDNGNTPLRDADVQTHTFTITDGVPNENSYTFGTINVPVIDGYVAEVKTAGGKTVTPDNPDANVTVVYHKIGKIVPVDKDHNPIPGVETPQYKNDPNDPTKVVPDEPVPTIDGYTPNQNTVTPQDPTKDTEVVYTKNNEPSPQPHPQIIPETPDTPNVPETPDEPENDLLPNTDETIQPHSQNDEEPSEKKAKTAETVKPHNTSIKTESAVKKIAAVKDVKENKKATLPQTGENNNEETSAAILGAAAASLGLIGLAGVKKRRKKD